MNNTEKLETIISNINIILKSDNPTRSKLFMLQLEKDHLQSVLDNIIFELKRDLK